MMHTLLTLHVAGGTVALLAMLVPLFSRKGGRLHRRAGWVFVGAMTPVCVTALLMSGIRFFTDPTPVGHQFSMLLFYVAILTGAGMWTGIRVLRAKQRTTRGPAIDIAGAALVTVSGALAAIYGFTTGQPLFIAFSTIGVVNGGSELLYWLRRPTEPMHWWFAHMGNMLGACIAATTAFAIAGGRRVGIPGDSLLAWLGPTAIGLPGIFFWVRHYRRRFSSSSARPTPRQAGLTTLTTLVVLLTGPTSAPAGARILASGSDGKAFERGTMHVVYILSDTRISCHGFSTHQRVSAVPRATTILTSYPKTRHSKEGESHAACHHVDSGGGVRALERHGIRAGEA
jgi:uncharacterized membrane protein